MDKALQRLLLLRQRQKAAAAAALRQTALARDAEQACIDAPVAAAGVHVVAGDLAALQGRREASYVRIEALAERFHEGEQALGQAKQALRQIELLVEGRAKRRQSKVVRRENGEREDWVRARAHREDMP